MSMKIDLARNVLPISKAASSLAALIKWASSTGQPIIITQKGYPTGVLVSVERFVQLQGLAAQDAADRLLSGFVPDAPELDSDALYAALVEAGE